MNDAELRRKELLESTRSMYSDQYHPPLIHPRYTNNCDMYRENEKQTGSFGFRVFLCCMILTVFVIADNKDLKLMNVDSKQIINAVEESDLLQVWKEL